VPRALISTLPPSAGGVPAMLRVALALLAERGIATDVAWYEPWSLTPELSVPLFRLGTRRVGSERREVPGAAQGHAIGAWLPELEVTHYRPTVPWRKLIACADLHLVVSGTAMAGRAFADTGTPFLAWIASDWHGDRKDRVRGFPWPRRMLDRFVVRPLATRLERRILRQGQILALSEPTRRALDAAAGRPVVSAVLPQPIDLETFRPDPTTVVPGRIGFVGRFDDPRKNLALFLDALALARRSDDSLAAEIVGREPEGGHLEAVERRGLGSAVTFAGELTGADYARRLRTLDLLCLTSHQEGLGIAALEAMASGCPVVATRCGGPEEFVADGENGYLTGFSAEEIAARLVALAGNRARRAGCSAAARRTVERGYAWPRVREIFGRSLDELMDAMERRKKA